MMEWKKVDKMMDDNPSIKKAKFMNSIFGLWPGGSKCNKAIRRFIVVIDMLVFSSTQVYGILLKCGDSDPESKYLCAEFVSGCTLASGVYIKFLLPIIFEKKLETIFTNLAEIWASITDPQEIKILKECAKSATFVSFVYLTYSAFACNFYTHSVVITALLDIVKPLNETRKRYYVANAEYPFNPDDYYYQIHVYLSFSAYIAIGVLLTSDVTFAAIIYEVTTLFAIMKYRMAKAASEKNDDASCKLIISGVKMHRRALIFHETLEFMHRFPSLVFIGACTLFISMGTLAAITKIDDVIDRLRLPLLQFAVVVHLTYLSYAGQALINESDDLFLSASTVQNVEKIEKSSEFIMLRCQKPCYVTAGGLYVLNNENLAMLMKLNVSYIMAALKMQ